MTGAAVLSELRPAGTKKARVSHLKWVRVDDIVPSPLGQREFRAAKANKMAADFKLEALGYPVLSYRDGMYYVIDGQHRLAAARIFGFGNDQFQCEVYEGLTQEDEAEMFLERNESTPVLAFDKFKAGVHAQRPEELSIYRVVSGLGLNIARARSENTVSAVGALRRVHARIGPIGLSRVLRTLHEAYGSRGLDGPVLEGLALVLHRYDGQVDDTLMVKRLGNTAGGLNGVLGPAAKLKVRLGQRMTECIAAQIVDIYNREQRTKKLAPWWTE